MDGELSLILIVIGLTGGWPVRSRPSIPIFIKNWSFFFIRFKTEMFAEAC